MPQIINRKQIAGSLTKSLLCLDIGFSNMGYSIFQKGELWAQGLLITRKSTTKITRVSDDYANRIASLAHQLRTLCNPVHLIGICAELPSGSQNARAAAQMAMATAVVVTTALFLDLPIEYYTAQEVKIAATGNKKASKEEIMDAIAEKFGFNVEVKTSNITKGKRKGKITERKIFSIGNKCYSGGDFEHIADSIGVFLAASHNNLVRGIK